MTQVLIGGVGPDGKWKPAQVDADGKVVVTGVSGGPGGTGDASAANQTLQITAATLANTRIGAVDEAAPASDSASSGLNGLLRRLLGRFPTLGAKAGSASFSVVPATGALTSLGSTITTGGTAQTLASSNSARVGLMVQNTSTGELRVNPWGAASASAGYKVGADQLLVLDAPHCGVGAISIWGATTGQTFQAGEAV